MHTITWPSSVFFQWLCLTRHYFQLLSKNWKAFKFVTLIQIKHFAWLYSMQYSNKSAQAKPQKEKWPNLGELMFERQQLWFHKKYSITENSTAKRNKQLCQHKPCYWQQLWHKFWVLQCNNTTPWRFCQTNTKLNFNQTLVCYFVKLLCCTPMYFLFKCNSGNKTPTQLFLP